MSRMPQLQLSRSLNRSVRCDCRAIYRAHWFVVLSRLRLHFIEPKLIPIHSSLQTSNGTTSKATSLSDTPSGAGHMLSFSQTNFRWSKCTLPYCIVENDTLFTNRKVKRTACATRAMETERRDALNMNEVVITSNKLAGYEMQKRQGSHCGLISLCIWTNFNAAQLHRSFKNVLPESGP